MESSILKMREFINRERVYVLMLSFILLVNAWLIFAQKVPAVKESFIGKKMFQRGIAKQVAVAEEEYIQRKVEKLAWVKLLEQRGGSFNLMNILGSLALLVFAFGLFLDIRILMTRVKKRPLLNICATHLPVNWGMADIFRLVIIFVFLGYLLHLLEKGFLLPAKGTKGVLNYMALLNTGIMDLVLLGFILYFVKVKYSQSLAALGLRSKDAPRYIFLAILSYIAFLPLLAFLLLLMVALSALFNYEPTQHTLFKLFLQERNLWFLIYATLMVVFLGPIVEEVFFRGFSYNAIKRRWGAFWAMVVTAFVFAGLHTNLVGFLPIMALGFLLAYVYEKTGSLICPITIHILHNSLMVALLFLGRHFIQLTN